MKSKWLYVPWFLWSILYPGNQYYDKDIHATVVHEYSNQEECEKGLKEYRVEVDKAYPQPELPGGTTYWVTWPTVTLKCSPINPKP